MRRIVLFELALALLVLPQAVRAQAWKSILAPGRAIDWSGAGVGAIPARATVCARLTPSATLDQINAALASCPAEQTVLLGPGRYSIPGSIRVPSHVTLRGAGANKTILNATGTLGGWVVSMGFGNVPYHPVPIASGATAGSTSLMLRHAGRITPGMYLAIAERNDPSYVTTEGAQANCDWCDGWTHTGTYSRGQIVRVTQVRGDRVAISPALYSAYNYDPIAVPFNMADSYAGVEDLQVFANQTGYAADFGMAQCAFCWIKGVEANYTDNDFVEVLWGYHDEVRDSYFSNAFRHAPGEHDSGIHVGYKTSASLFENNIVIRGRVSFNLGWGAAGNVFAYNYTSGEFIADAPNAVIGGFRFHGAHPQFNLFEGNVVSEFDEDAVWGSSSHSTVFRNWFMGTNRVCMPHAGRASVSCSGANGHYGFQAARAVQISYLGSRNNFVGNLLGSAQMQSLTGYGRRLAQVPFVAYPMPRSYDHSAYGWSFGYGSFDDDGSGSGCGGGQPPCHLRDAAASNFFHGNYNNIDQSIRWATGVIHTLPPSFYLAGRPLWWGGLPFPSIGPDISGGSDPDGHSFGNPAQRCYLQAMGGSDGGAGGPLTFDPALCYGGKQP